MILKICNLSFYSTGYVVYEMIFLKIRMFLEIT